MWVRGSRRHPGQKENKSNTFDRFRRFLSFTSRAGNVWRASLKTKNQQKSIENIDTKNRTNKQVLTSWQLQMLTLVPYTFRPLLSISLLFKYVDTRQQKCSSRSTTFHYLALHEPFFSFFFFFFSSTYNNYIRAPSGECLNLVALNIKICDGRWFRFPFVASLMFTPPPPCLS